MRAAGLVGLVGLHPWEFLEYTVREFEERVASLQRAYGHGVDVVMRHALATGQWSKPVTFRDLTGRDQPLPLDARPRPPVHPEDAERAERNRAFLAEHAARMQGRDRDG